MRRPLRHATRGRPPVPQRTDSRRPSGVLLRRTLVEEAEKAATAGGFADREHSGLPAALRFPLTAGQPRTGTARPVVELPRAFITVKLRGSGEFLHDQIFRSQQAADHAEFHSSRLHAETAGVRSRQDRIQLTYLTNGASTRQNRRLRDQPKMAAPCPVASVLRKPVGPRCEVRPTRARRPGSPHGKNRPAVVCGTAEEAGPHGASAP